MKEMVTATGFPGVMTYIDDVLKRRVRCAAEERDEDLRRRMQEQQLVFVFVQERKASCGSRQECRS